MSIKKKLKFSLLCPVYAHTNVKLCKYSKRKNLLLETQDYISISRDFQK